MISIPTLHKHVTEINGNQLDVYFTDEDGIEIKRVAYFETGYPYPATQGDIAALISTIENTL